MEPHLDTGTEKHPGEVSGTGEGVTNSAWGNQRTCDLGPKVEIEEEMHSRLRKH